MKKIDAHVHVGYFGGWADVGLTAEQMVAAMDQHSIERTVISYMDNAVTEEAARQFPSRFAGLIWVNPYQPVEKVRFGLFQGGFAKTLFFQIFGNFTLFVRKVSARRLSSAPQPVFQRAVRV